MTHTEGVGWDVRLLREVEEWVLALDDDSYEQVAAAVDKLEHDGPTLGRPLVDRIEDSRHHNMKELRPGSAGRSEVRILFIFDPERRAVLLVAGDKAGNWKKWYDRNIPVADERYDAWLRAELHP